MAIDSARALVRALMLRAFYTIRSDPQVKGHLHYRAVPLVRRARRRPPLAPQPISESALLTGPLEPTNQWYAIAKIAGLMQCQAFREQHGCDFISAMPTNLYSPGDSFDLESAPVLPALMRRFRAAALVHDRKVTTWGTGTPRREFLHVDDCADALVFLLRHYSDAGTINVGVGSLSSQASLPPWSG